MLKDEKNANHVLEQRFMYEMRQRYERQLSKEDKEDANVLYRVCLQEIAKYNHSSSYSFLNNKNPKASAIAHVYEEESNCLGQI